MLNGWRDVRFGARMLARNKGFTAAAILALALGIGPNVAIFSVIWATFLAPLPYPQANQLAVVWTHHKGQRSSTRGEDYAEFAAESHSFQRLDFGSWNILHATNRDHSQQDIEGHPVTPGYYTKNLGIGMALGRGFLPDEGVPGKDRFVVLTHRLWETRYHADAGILGKAIRINDEPYTVLGVLRAGAADRIPGAQFLVPILLRPGVDSDQYGAMYGRLKPGVSIAQAQAELSVIERRLAPLRDGADDAKSWSISVEPLKDDFLNHKLVRNLWLLFAAVGLVLLIACANVANLLLARGSARRQELALRFSLGATRGQVFTQLLSESVALAVLGGAAGVGMGWAMMKATLAVLPRVTAEASIGINLPVLCFAVGATLLAGIVFGCAPALHAARLNLSETLKQGSRSVSGRGRTQGALVTAEFALTLTLLGGAAMAMHSFWNLSNVDPGVTTEHVLTAELEQRSPSGGSPMHAAAPPPEQIVANQRQLMERLRAIPGVEDAALTTNLPLESGYDSYPFAIAGQVVDPKRLPGADLEAVTPGFFHTFGVDLARGRFLADSDTMSSPLAVVVNQSFVRRYLPDSDPLGHSLMIAPMRGPNEAGKRVSYQIVGVFHDILNNHLADSAQPEMMISLWQAPWPNVSVAARTAVDPGAVSSGLRTAVAASNFTLDHVETMRQIMEGQLAGNRFGMTLFGAFAVVALLLAALGIYGVMSFAVAQRTHEVGIRMALGARKSEVVALMVRSGIRLALPGMAIGLAGVYALGRLMHGTLYGVGTVDYGSTALVAALLFVVAMIACWIPARRSSRVDPMVALREE